MTTKRAAATTRIVLIATLLPGCAHRRPAYSPGNPGQGVYVHAPFVDVHVQGSPNSLKHPHGETHDVDEDDRDDD